MTGEQIQQAQVRLAQLSQTYEVGNKLLSSRELSTLVSGRDLDEVMPYREAVEGVQQQLLAEAEQIWTLFPELRPQKG